MNWLNYFFCFCLLGSFACQQSNVNAQYNFQQDRDIMRGLSFVAPPNPFPADPMPAIQEVGANWIAVIPYAYTRVNRPSVNFNVSKWQWWGERPEGARITIQKAHAAGLNTMLKPQVYVPGSWPGGLDFPSEADWKAWENSYEEYILTFAKMAEEERVALFCIGTEFKVSSVNRPAFWESLIKKIRKIYSGKLTYAANWDEYQDIRFWKELDYIGVDAYFPLVQGNTPSIKSIVKAWQKPKQEMQKIAQRYQKPILFTEFGYLSVDGCAFKNWELEGKVKSLKINEKAQANAIHAILEAFWDTDYWHGGFVWKWFPNGEGHEGYVDRDYTPQGKLAEQVLRDWYMEDK